MPRSAISVNPYYFAGPIRHPSDFYGRERELGDVFECIRKHGSASIVGERRSGKTSLLLHMLVPEVQQRFVDERQDSLYALLDTQIMPRGPEGFVREVLKQVHARRPQLELAPDEGALNEQRLRGLLEALGPTHLVLLIDEFEGISLCTAFPSHFFEFLRGLCSNYALSLVVATRRPLVDCCPQETVTSGFPNIFKPVELGSFTPSEFEDFVQRTTLLNKAPIWELRDEIAAMAGYYPYLLQVACHHAFDLWLEKGSLSAEDVPLVCRRFEDDAASFFKAVWNRYLGDDERQELWLLAQGEQDVRPLHIRAISPEIIWRLEKKGYVRDGRVFSEVFAAFLRQQRLSDVSHGPLQESLAQIPPIGLWVNKEAGQVYLDGRPLQRTLTKHEFRLLELLWDHRGRICDAYEIVRAVWSEDSVDGVDDQCIAQLVTRLRKKVEPGGRPWRYIITVHGRGLTLKTGEPKAGA